MCLVFFFKQKTAYEMRISDWSSDVCSSDLMARLPERCGDHFCGEQQGRRACPFGEIEIAEPNRRPPRIFNRIAGIMRDFLIDEPPQQGGLARRGARQQDRKSVVKGKSVSVRVDVGARRILKKKRIQKYQRCRSCQNLIMYMIRKQRTREVAR